MDENNYFDKYDSNHTTAVTQDTGQPSSDDNYFNKYDNQPGSGNTSINNKSSQINDSGAFMAGVENFNRVFGNMAEGVIDLIAKGIGSKNLEQRVTNVHNSLQESADIAANNHPIAAGIGTTAGIIGSAALPLGAASGSSLGARVLSSGGASALTGFLNYAPSLEQRMNNGALSGLIGAAIPIAGKGYLSSLNTIKDDLSPQAIQSGSGILSKLLTPNKAAIKDATAEINNNGGLEGVLSNNEKFNNTNIPAAMTDAAASPGLNADIKNIPMNIERRGQLQQFVNSQNNAAQQEINKTLENIIPGGYKTNKDLRDQLYSSMGDKLIPDDVMSQISSSPSIAIRLKNINNNTDLNINDLSDNSLAKLDLVKQELDNDIWANTKQLKTGERTSLSSSEASSLKQTRADLVNILDNTFPEYKDIRQAGERLHYYNLFSDSLQKPTYKAGTNNKLTVDQIYNNLFGTPEKQEFFLNAVQRTGGNIENTKNLMDVLNLIKNSPLDKLINTANNKTAIGIGGDTAGIVQRFTNWLSQTRYQNALIKLNLNPQWQDTLEKALSQNTLKDKLLDITSIIKNVADTKISPAISKLKNAIPLLSSELTNRAQ